MARRFMRRERTEDAPTGQGGLAPGRGTPAPLVEDPGGPVKQRFAKPVAESAEEGATPRTEVARRAVEESFIAELAARERELEELRAEKTLTIERSSRRLEEIEAQAA